ncbi:thioredoxin O, mitochondrial-like [Phragmites australis]|uniref:thioredoxin O, mitochondrial-like n=1 Tax=Phragmites australis TaxID=29695 RepID=UPI002D7858D5|nr:thioredoxin O, mitochondrial-like [Phragmites australis]
MARRLCRLPRLFPLVASASAAKPHPHLHPLAVNPNPAPLLPSFSQPPPSLPALTRLFSSSAGGSSMVVIGSADSFTSVLSKVQDEKLPAVFYYTAVWCGPCRAIAPVISKLSSQYPNIPLYKVDIDMEGLGSKLGDLKIFSVPTFHFYHKGQKTSEIVGADVKKLEAAMENLHKQQ